MLPLRQYRKTQDIRDKNAETVFKRDAFIEALFVADKEEEKTEIKDFPGVYRYGYKNLLKRIESLLDAGIDKILLFGVPESDKKDSRATYALRPDSVVPRAVSLVKKSFPEISVFTDVCVCSYTDHGHCGIEKNGDVDNDATLPLLAGMAKIHADAGADWVCPSAMMDGQVEAIRTELDKSNHKRTKILSYSAKYASSLYGPFRNAALSAPAFGDRKGYQMDIRNSAEAITECWADIKEGADAIMVKPALFYLDIISRIRSVFSSQTIAAYLVSGEYSIINKAVSCGISPAAWKEAVTAILRAGADWIISYNTDIIAGQMESSL